MAEKTIAEQVKAIVADKLSVDISEVVETASFSGDLGADSLDTVEMIMEFEKVFDIKVPEGEEAKITTVGEAIKFIEDAKK